MRIYQRRLATSREIARWFSNEERGLALITGAISGGLEALDFDSRVIYEGGANVYSNGDMRRSSTSSPAGIWR